MRTAPPPPVAERSTADWERIEHSAAFVDLIRAKASFIVPATAFFLIYFFALPILVGYAPGLMETKVVGNINLAYVFALSQFVMTWGVMALYVRRARDYDERAAAIVSSIEGGPRP